MLSQNTADYLVKRATDGNVLDKIDFEPDTYHDDKSYFQITGIYDGALDEEFVVGGHYEIKVADWLAEEYERCRDLNGGDWMIHVYQFYPEFNPENWYGDDLIGDLVYKLDNGEMVELIVDDAGLENPR